MDPLADVMEVSGVRGALLASLHACAPWGIDLPQADGASFHAVTAGTGWLRTADQPPRQLMPGDILLMPTGMPHKLSSEVDLECRPFDRAMKEQLMTPEGDMLLAGSGAATTFICACYDYDHEVAQPLMSLLPAVLHVPASPTTGAHLSAIVGLLAAEVGSNAPGSSAAVSRLIDLLFIGAVRSWALTADGDASWLRALRDPTIARTLAVLHDRPEEQWTVEKLAAEAHVSRATLSRRFTELVGEPPLAYLTRWRMDLAARRLRETVEPVEHVANAVGYSSEYAFSRAFSRHRGLPPGRYRREAMQVT